MATIACLAALATPLSWAQTAEVTASGEVSPQGTGGAWTNIMDLYVGIVGTGTLDIKAGGTVSSMYGYLGYGKGSTGSTGTVTVTGTGSDWTNSEWLFVGNSGTGTLNIEAGGKVSSMLGVVGANNGGTGTATVTGAGSTWTNSGDLYVSHSGTGTLKIEAGGKVSNTYGYVGNSYTGTGTVTVTGTGSDWTNSGELSVGFAGTGTLTVDQQGLVKAQRVTLGGGGNSNATLHLNGNTANGRGVLETGQVSNGGGIAALHLNGGTLRAAGTQSNFLDGFDALTLGTQGVVFDTNGFNIGVGTDFSSGTAQISGLTKEGAGTLTLSGVNTYIGATHINSGLLAINGSVAGDVSVNNGGTLGGGGTIGGDVNVANGGTLAAGNSPGTLTITGDLVLGSGSITKFELGQAGVVGGSSNDLVKVGHDFTLDGKLSATVSSAGWYRLFNYGGTLTHNGVSQTVDGVGGFSVANATLDTGVTGQVNLAVLGAGQNMQFWNGNHTVAANGVQGGSGTWANFGVNWTDSDGDSPAGWGGSVAVFEGTAGTVTVADNVAFDTLQFSTDGYVVDGGLTGQLQISAATGTEGVINTLASVNTTISASIAGTGSQLRKLGAGTLTLSGTNTYTGGTTVAGGTLSVASDANLGAVSGALLLDGGTLQIAGRSFADNGNRTWQLGNAGGGIDIADAGHAFTLDSVLSGAGALHKTGAGTLTLTGASNYSGGTAINAGTLALGANGSLAATGAVELAASGTVFDISVASGAQTIGALVGVAGSSVVLGNQALTLGDAASTTFAGAFSGTGALTKQGSGVLTLAGDSSSFSGSTIVQSGSLLLNNAKLGGALTVGSGAVLAGNGTVGSAGRMTTVKSGATIRPGTSSAPGTLKVQGDLTFESGAVYQVQADPNGTTSSLIDVAGTATLAGGVLHVGNEVDALTDFQVGKTYTILKAAGGLSGKFDTETSGFAYLDAKLDYSIANQVDLELKRKSSGGNNGGQMRFADLANTSNQGAAANAIESLPSNHPLFQHIETLPAGTPAGVFTSLSGDTHATIVGSMNMLSAQAPSISQQHLRNNLTAGFRAGAPIAQSDGPLPASALPSSKALPAWVEVVGHWQKMDGNSNTPGVKQNTTGLFLGADEEVGSSGWRVGGSVGYTSADAQIKSRDSSADISSYSAAVYAGKGFSHGSNRINVMGGLAYTKHSIESERSVATLNQNLKADYSAHTAQLFAEVGYAMGQYDKQGFEPFVGITLGEQRTNSFKESGGFAALNGESSKDTLASTTLGVRAHSDFVLAGKDTRVRGTLGVRHAWGKLSQNRTMAFEGSSSFTVAGAPLARNTALVGLQAEMALSRYSALVLGYNGEYGSGSRDQSASVKVRWAF